MKIYAVPVAVLLCAGMLAAQQGTPNRGPRANAMQTDQLKTYLGLSDQQVQDISGVQSSFRQAAQPLMQQMAEKSKDLRQAMQQNPVDSSLVNQLKSDLSGLRDQMQSLRTQYRAQAQGYLTEDQKTKLGALEQALTLLPAARQAAGMNLLEAPAGAAGWGPGPMPRGRRAGGRRPAAAPPQ
jgi:Spy/CpxP family protein refolding chaperone